MDRTREHASTGVVVSYRNLAEEILRRPTRLGRVRLIAVDGPSGAGKSTFALRLSNSLDRAPIIETDDFGSWEEPLDWWVGFETEVLDPLGQGLVATYQSYDWLPRRARGLRTVEQADVVILEGVSSARLEVADRLSMAIWIEAPEQTRLARGLARDGMETRSAWERWMTDEAAHHAANRTRERADLIVDGAPDIRHDPELEFVRLGGSSPAEQLEPPA